MKNRELLKIPIMSKKEKQYIVGMAKLIYESLENYKRFNKIYD